MNKLFINYSRKDVKQVTPIVTYLENNGFEILIDRTFPTAKSRWDSVIESVNECDALVYILTEESAKSEWCKESLWYADARRRPIFPLIMQWQNNYEFDFVDELHEALRKEISVDELEGGGEFHVFNYYRSEELVRNELEEAIDHYKNNPDRYKDQFVSPPPEPGRDADSLFNDAMDYAAKTGFLQAISKLRELQYIHPQVSDVCEEYIETINKYQELYRTVADVDDNNPTKKSEWYSKWNDYKLFAEDAGIGLYDPLKINEYISNNPKAHSSNVNEYYRSHNVKKNVIVFSDESSEDEDNLLPSPFDWIKIPRVKKRFRKGFGGFHISKYPIINAQYDAFLNSSNGYNIVAWWAFQHDATKWRVNVSSPKVTAYEGDDLPRTNVTWFEAVAYCRWLSAQLGEKIMLPTVDQWRYAASANNRKDYLYPWGNEWKSHLCNNSVGSSEGATVTPVTLYERGGTSPFGVADMAGNVWEWCLTDYDTNNNKTKNVANYRTLVGGGRTEVAEHQYSVKSRLKMPPNRQLPIAGFRIVMLD